MTKGMILFGNDVEFVEVNDFFPFEGTANVTVTSGKNKGLFFSLPAETVMVVRDYATIG